MAPLWHVGPRQAVGGRGGFAQLRVHIEEFYQRNSIIFIVGLGRDHEVACDQGGRISWGGDADSWARCRKIAHQGEVEAEITTGLRELVNLNRQNIDRQEQTRVNSFCVKVGGLVTRRSEARSEPG